MHGLLVIDKPAKMTSREVVDLVEDWFPGVRVGHAGTLDPLAMGVLVLCLGVATRLIEYVQRLPKTYAARVRLGATSDTHDAAGVIVSVAAAQAPLTAELENALRSFAGDIEQVPPDHSAARLAGRRAYDLVRRGRRFELAPRRVTIHQIELLKFDYPDVDVQVICGKGTYLRALARDLGRRLGCGGLLQSLVRTAIGPFFLQDAMPLSAGPESAHSRLLPIAQAIVVLPRLTLSPLQLSYLRHGRRIPWPEQAEWRATGAKVELAVFDEHEQLVGIADWFSDGQYLHAAKILVMNRQPDSP